MKLGMLDGASGAIDIGDDKAEALAKARFDTAVAFLRSGGSLTLTEFAALSEGEREAFARAGASVVEERAALAARHVMLAQRDPTNYLRPEERIVLAAAGSVR